MVWVFTLGFESDLRIAPCSGSLLDFYAGISFPCRGAVATRCRAAYYEVYLPLHGTFRVERWLMRLSYKPIEVATTYEVFNLVLQVIALLDVVSIVVVSRCSSSFYLISRRDVAVGFSQALAKKLASNSLMSWSKEWIEVSDSQPYHPRAIPHRVVEKARHIMASDVPYKAICAQNAATCSIGSEPPSYASSVGRRKCCGMGVSWISWIKGEPLATLVFHPDGLVDIVNSLLPLKSLRSYRQDPEIKWGGVSPKSLNRCQYHLGVREGATQQDLELGEDTRGLPGWEMFWSFFPSFRWGESPESPHGVYFTCVCWRSVISFQSVFVASSAGVSNAAGTVGGCLHRGRVCLMWFLPCCREIFSDPQDLMEIA
ncbi:hypothetical protein BHE74_00010015 [Ensete ventricosum]|nr:hypothetical protein BHE74_00010015 [Ensete ventricosum]